MNRALLISALILLLILAACGGDEYDKYEVKEINGKFYEVRSDNLVSGKVFERYETGMLKRESIVDKGIVHTDRHWYDTGQLQREYTIDPETRDSSLREWDELGRLSRESVDGLLEVTGKTKLWVSGILIEEATFQHGVRNGLSIIYENGANSSPGSQLRRNYSEGMLSGLSQERQVINHPAFPGGRLSTIIDVCYERGEKIELQTCGEGTTYVVQEDGRLIKEVWGPVDGSFTTWRRSGALQSERPHRHRRLHGVVRYYDNDGNLEQEQDWKDGVRHPVIRFFHESGKLGSEVTFAHDQQNGPAKNYYESGQLRGEGNYLNNKRQGIWHEYYESGELSVEAGFLEGDLHGFYRKYNIQGYLEEEVCYMYGLKDGLIDGICWVRGKKADAWNTCESECSGVFGVPVQ